MSYIARIWSWVGGRLIPDTREFGNHGHAEAWFRRNQRNLHQTIKVYDRSGRVVFSNEPPPETYA